MSRLEAISTEQLSHACRAVSLFPLPSVVLIPNTVMPLHVFEERYRDLVRDCLKTELRLISVPLLADGWEQSYSGSPPIHATAGVGRIVNHERLPDGRYNIALLGIGRIHIEQELPLGRLYRTAQATLLQDQLPPSGKSGLSTHLQHLRMMLAQLIILYPRLQPELGHFIEVTGPSPVLVDALAHLVFSQPKPRQQYIEEDRLTARADLVLEGLAGVIARSSHDIPEA